MRHASEIAYSVTNSGTGEELPCHYDSERELHSQLHPLSSSKTVTDSDSLVPVSNAVPLSGFMIHFLWFKHVTDSNLLVPVSNAVPLSGFMIQTNKGSFGISPTNQVRTFYV